MFAGYTGHMLAEALKEAIQNGQTEESILTMVNTWLESAPPADAAIYAFNFLVLEHEFPEVVPSYVAAFLIEQAPHNKYIMNLIALLLTEESLYNNFHSVAVTLWNACPWGLRPIVVFRRPWWASFLVDELPKASELQLFEFVKALKSVDHSSLVKNAVSLPDLAMSVPGLVAVVQATVQQIIAKKHYTAAGIIAALLGSQGLVTSEFRKLFIGSRIDFPAVFEALLLKFPPGKIEELSNHLKELHDRPLLDVCCQLRPLAYDDPDVAAETLEGLIKLHAAL